MYIKKTRIDVFEKAWQLLTEPQSSAPSGSALPEREQKTLGSEAPTTCVQAEEPDLAKAEQKPKRTAASSPGGKPNNLPKVPETTADQKKELATGLAKATKTKAHVIQVLSTAKAVLRSIDEEEAWSWANSPKIRDGPQQIIRELESIMNRDTATKHFVCESLAEFKASATVETQKVLITTMADADAKAHIAEKAFQRLKRMHKAFMSDNVN